VLASPWGNRFPQLLIHGLIWNTLDLKGMEDCIGSQQNKMLFPLLFGKWLTMDLWLRWWPKSIDISCKKQRCRIGRKKSLANGRRKRFAKTPFCFLSLGYLKVVRNNWLTYTEIPKGTIALGLTKNVPWSFDRGGPLPFTFLKALARQLRRSYSSAWWLYVSCPGNNHHGQQS